MPETIAIICSDEPRNGKTLLSRVYGGCLSLSGPQSFHVFDTDQLHGALAGYFPKSAELIDLTKTQDQVKLFDSILAAPQKAWLIDLQAEWLRNFFRIFHDIGFDAAARESGLAISVYYMLDRSLNSVATMQEISTLLGAAHLIPVRNEAIGSVLTIPKAALIYEETPKLRELMLPHLSVDAINWIDRPDFDFAGFIAKNGEDVPLELRIELWSFLEAVYNQRRADANGGLVVL